MKAKKGERSFFSVDSDVCREFFSSSSLLVILRTVCSYVHVFFFCTHQKSWVVGGCVALKQKGNDNL
jgi:hypothetical protein